MSGPHRELTEQLKAAARRRALNPMTNLLKRTDLDTNPSVAIALRDLSIANPTLLDQLDNHGLFTFLYSQIAHLENPWAFLPDRKIVALRVTLDSRFNGLAETLPDLDTESAFFKRVAYLVTKDDACNTAFNQSACINHIALFYDSFMETLMEAWDQYLALPFGTPAENERCATAMQHIAELMQTFLLVPMQSTYMSGLMGDPDMRLAHYNSFAPHIAFFLMHVRESIDPENGLKCFTQSSLLCQELKSLEKMLTGKLGLFRNISDEQLQQAGLLLHFFHQASLMTLADAESTFVTLIEAKSERTRAQLTQLQTFYSEYRAATGNPVEQLNAAIKLIDWLSTQKGRTAFGSITKHSKKALMLAACILRMGLATAQSFEGNVNSACGTTTAEPTDPSRFTMDHLTARTRAGTEPVTGTHSRLPSFSLRSPPATGMAAQSRRRRTELMMAAPTLPTAEAGAGSGSSDQTATHDDVRAHLIRMVSDRSAGAAPRTRRTSRFSTVGASARTLLSQASDTSGDSGRALLVTAMAEPTGARTRSRLQRTPARRNVHDPASVRPVTAAPFLDTDGRLRRVSIASTAMTTESGRTLLGGLGDDPDPTG